MTNEEIIKKLKNNLEKITQCTVNFVRITKETMLTIYTEMLNKIEELVAENEQLKQDINNAEVHADCMEAKASAYEAELNDMMQQNKNNPLTLDEVKELKSGEVVWIKQEVYLTSQKEIEPVEFYTAMKKQWLFLMIGDFEGHGKLYDELNKDYFVYRNKPEIADVSKKE